MSEKLLPPPAAPPPRRSVALAWARRLGGGAITLAIFYYMIRPVVKHWDQVRGPLASLNFARFAVAAAMFSGFLWFRAISWRRILIGLGHRLPMAPAVRIWSLSELARYIPGAVSQVVGRVYLIRPFGVSAAVSSTSQILELAAFLLANFILAATCLLWYGVKQANVDARPWLIVAMVITPALGFVLHPRIFYGLVDRVLRRLGKRPLTARLGGWALLRLLARLEVALLWQSAAVFLLVGPVLHLRLGWWWTVAGAYCLAWCAGFLAVWAPGGAGVRELVFVAVLKSYLATKASSMASLPQTDAELYFLAIVLRLWTIAGELLLAGLASASTARPPDQRRSLGSVVDRPVAPALPADAGRAGWRSG